MDHWDLVGKLRAPTADALRRWADLEGKSPTMRDDLYRKVTLPRSRKTIAFAILAASTKLMVAILNAWLTNSR